MRNLLATREPRGLVRRALLGRLRDLEGGRLVVDGETLGDPAADLAAAVTVRDPAFWSRVAFGGTIGAAEAWMDGQWECDDLVALVRILVRNRDVLQSLEGGWARLIQPLRKLVHVGRRNSKRGSRRNIADHYDLGNDFFSLFLDESLTYSCAYFAEPGLDLAAAQRAKYDLVCRRLGIGPDDHVLEIGTGWGGFAIHAARERGCRVTTTTISEEQRALAIERVRAAGLEERVLVLLQDYRDLEGEYDKLVSIEMIEAVGHEYYDAFFEACSRLLRPDGAMLLQAIVVRDRHYDECRREVDFIKRYVFPGSCIPSVAALTGAMARASDLMAASLDDLTSDYARTLRLWRERFLRNRAAIAALGYPEEFLRMWEFYLAYCEGGFRERFLGDVQLTLTKPRSRLEVRP